MQERITPEVVVECFLGELREKGLVLTYTAQEEDFNHWLANRDNPKRKTKYVGPIFYVRKERRKRDEDHVSRNDLDAMENMLRTWMLQHQFTQTSQTYIRNLLKIVRAKIAPHSLVAQLS